MLACYTLLTRTFMYIKRFSNFNSRQAPLVGCNAESIQGLNPECFSKLGLSMVLLGIAQIPVQMKISSPGNVFHILIKVSHHIQTIKNKISFFAWFKLDFDCFIGPSLQLCSKPVLLYNFPTQTLVYEGCME